MIKGIVEGHEFFIDDFFNVTCKDVRIKQLIESGIMVWFLDLGITSEKQTPVLAQKLKNAGATILECVNKYDTPMFQDD